MFKRMTPYKLERNTVGGKALYSYADPQRGVVYIGGDKAYQRYRQLALQQSIEEKRLRRPIAITSKLSIRNSARTTTEKIGNEAARAAALPKSLLAKAANYTRTLWPRL